MKQKLWRQGDVMIIAIQEIPTEAKKEKGLVLAYGEVTNHSHIVSDGNALLLALGTERFLSIISATAVVTHEEHAPITLPKGKYQVRIQSEYSPEAIRNVAD